MLTSSLSSKGQVTIPLAVRRRLGLKEGDRVEFVMEGDDTILRPVRSGQNPFTEYIGAVPVFADMAEVNSWVRGMRDEDDPQENAAE
jgi:antitoxin PrlF